MTNGSSKALAVANSGRTEVRGVAISSDGRLVAASGFDAVRIWDARSGRFLGKLQGGSYGACNVAFTPDACGLVSGSWDTTLKYWDVSRIGTREGYSACTMNFIGHNVRVELANRGCV